MKKVLHIFNKNVLAPEYYHMGSTRDTRGRFEYFRERGIHSDQLVLKSRRDDVLYEKFRGMDKGRLSKYHAIVFEYPRYPKSMRYLRKNYPGIRLLVRSHNAEVFHQMQYALLTLRFSSSRKDLLQSYRLFKLALSRILLDRRCSKLSHGILSITEWESRNYWRYFVKKAKVFTVPYFLPSEYSTASKNDSSKKNQCVCVMSPFRGRLVFLEDALRNYARCIERMPLNGADWKFFVTGDLSYYNFSLPDNLVSTGFIESPFELMLESTAMALLSDYGFGFKTKILEAIEAQCYTLLTQKLYDRLPEQVKPYCLIVDVKSAKSFHQALESSRKPFPVSGTNANEELKALAFAGFDKAMNLN